MQTAHRLICIYAVVEFGGITESQLLSFAFVAFCLLLLQFHFLFDGGL